MEEDVPSGSCNRTFSRETPLIVQTSLDPYERALYGSVSGDVASVLPVCETWEDHLWVHISALLEQGVEDGLELEAARGNGAFWVNGATVPTPSSAPVRTEESTKKELASIFDGLLKGTKLGGGKDPFHVSQTYLILGNINALFENFLTRIEALGEELDPECVAPPAHPALTSVQDVGAAAPLLCPSHPDDATHGRAHERGDRESDHSGLHPSAGGD